MFVQLHFQVFLNENPSQKIHEMWIKWLALLVPRLYVFHTCGGRNTSPLCNTFYLILRIRHRLGTTQKMYCNFLVVHACSQHYSTGNTELISQQPWCQPARPETDGKNFSSVLTASSIIRLIEKFNFMYVCQKYTYSSPLGCLPAYSLLLNVLYWSHGFPNR